MSDMPLIHSVSSTQGKFPPRIVSFKSPCWILDSGLIQSGVYFRVGEAPESWIPRKVANLHLYRPGVRVWERYTDSPFTEMHGLTFIFKMEEAGEFTHKFPLQYDFFEFLDPEDKVKSMMQEACKLASELSPGILRDMRSQSILLHVLYILLQSEHIQDNLYTVKQSSRETDFTSQINTYMRKRLAEKISVAEIARYMHASEIQIFKRYKKENGISPMKQLARMRIEKAKSLIVRGISLDYVAEQTGFYDAFHLTKTFKRLEGISPREYREKVAGS